MTILMVIKRITGSRKNSVVKVLANFTPILTKLSFSDKRRYRKYLFIIILILLGGIGMIYYGGKCKHLLNHVINKFK